MQNINGWWLPAKESHLGRFIRTTGEYQKPHRDHALSHVKNWDVALDVGAHVGLWARDLCSRFGHVHCFEPVAEHRECFVKNITADNFTLYPVALGESDGMVKMAIDPENTGGTHIDQVVVGDIPMKTLDSYGFEKVDFIKIDCESYEVNVLKGGAETLKRCKPIICIEQKPHKWFGHGQYDGSKYLFEIGAKYLGNYADDLCFGW